MADGGLLAVRGLSVRHAGAAEPVFTGLDLDLAPGECLAVVGPSGCGKSTLCRALLDLLPAGALCDGSIRWRGVEVTGDSPSWRRLRGAGIGLLLQDHRFALDPIRRVGPQVAEVVRRHHPEWNRDRVATAALDLLAEVNLPGPPRMARRYPHQLSGGQRQRACLAAALAAGPRLLLADEPTSALDPLVQLDIIRLLHDLVQRRGLSLLLVTHDRDLVPLIAARTLVWPQPVDPAPSAGRTAVAVPPSPADASAPVCLRVEGLRASVAAAEGRQTVLRDVDLALSAGRTLGLAGESGAGKTTLARVLAGWHPHEAGHIELAGGGDLSAGRRLRAVQLVSQDAVAALDPRQRALAAVVEAARADGDRPAAAIERARSLLREVDLDADLEQRLPAELSGGQRQRVQLARALAARPQVLVADEPASSLDQRRRDGLVRLLRRLQRSHGLALLVISHDLAWLESWCDDVAVMLAGLLVEQYRPGAPRQPRHPYARDLVAAAPGALRRESLVGAPLRRPLPDRDLTTAPGCPYAARCALVQPACRVVLPRLRDMTVGHRLRCPPADHHGR